MNSNMGLKGKVFIEHIRDGKVIGKYYFSNAIGNQGKNSALTTLFGAAAAITPWYLGMIDSSGYVALAVGDTYQNINQAGNQWAEFTGYTDGNNGDNASTRPTWGAGTAVSQAITNASPEIFNITAPGTVVGVFVVGGIVAAQNKNDHAASGVLWATALMGSPIPVAVSDQLKITYTVTA